MLLQATNDESATMRRVLKYVIPVFAASVAFNAPKFLEADLVWQDRDGDGQLEPELAVTALRRNPQYAFYYNNCLRLVVINILPFAMLVFFNTKIYQDIQVGSTFLRADIKFLLLFFYAYWP